MGINLDEAKSIRRKLENIIRDTVRFMPDFRNAFRSYKATVIVAPDNGTCTVRLVGEKQNMVIPYSSCCADVQVGDNVFVGVIGNSLNNAFLWQKIITPSPIVYPIFGVSGVGGQSTSLTRLYDAVGLTATPSTDTVAGQSDFDLYPPFNRKKCVGSWSLVNGKAKFTPQAYYGDDDYAEDGTKGDYVAVDVLPFYWHFDHATGEVAVSGTKHAGFELHPVCADANGKARQHTYLPCYELALKDGKPVSLPGFHPEFGAYKELWDKCRLYGNGTLAEKCILEPADVNHYEWLLLTIEYATTNAQTVIGGACNMRSASADTIQLSGTNVNEVVVTGTTGDYFIVGQSIYIGAAIGDTPSTGVAAYNIITSIEHCDADGTLNPSGTHRKITFDGNPRTVTAGTTHIASRPWITGSASSVIGHTGSPVSNTDRKYPFRYRWRENIYGNINSTCIDLIGTRVADGDGYKLQWYYNSLYKNKGAATTSNPASVAELTEAAGWHLLPVETDKNQASGYIVALEADPLYPSIVVVTNTTGGSATTYYADYATITSGNTMRIIRRGGNIVSNLDGGINNIIAAYGGTYKQHGYGAYLYFAQ